MPGGPERIDRAHDAITMVKMVLRFNAALRRPDCKQLIDDLKNAGSLVNFEKGGAREEEMTFAYASAFVRKAIELGAKGIIPLERARSHGDRRRGAVRAAAAAKGHHRRAAQDRSRPRKGAAPRRDRDRVRRPGLDRLLHLGEHRRLALAHQDVEVEVPRGGELRPDNLQPAVSAARGRAARSAHRRDRHRRARLSGAGAQL
jgi:hypothetical protein